MRKILCQNWLFPTIWYSVFGPCESLTKYWMEYHYLATTTQIILSNTSKTWFFCNYSTIPSSSDIINHMFYGPWPSECDATENSFIYCNPICYYESQVTCVYFTTLNKTYDTPSLVSLMFPEYWYFVQHSKLLFLNTLISLPFFPQICTEFSAKITASPSLF